MTRAAVACVVSMHHGKEIALMGLNACKWKIGGLTETAFKENENSLEELMRLNHHATGMEIIGTLDNFTPSSSGHLILMLCIGDRRVYGCADDRVEVICSLEELFEEGPHFPVEELFNHPTKSDCVVPKQCEDNPEGAGGRLYYDTLYIGDIGP
ncbi:hypothetical protein AALO_G00170670 [Alosa alosa]|uniref:Uncharacterized protein n=1 Tax=Alosa alosa TaxID=278164 RepID=A0AAV6GCR9_9TELE|nr:hypothetical protein AALO_G00170670 [Alosa alosa]